MPALGTILAFQSREIVATCCAKQNILTRLTLNARYSRRGLPKPKKRRDTNPQVNGKDQYTQPNRRGLIVQHTHHQSDSLRPFHQNPSGQSDSHCDADSENPQHDNSPRFTSSLNTACREEEKYPTDITCENHQTTEQKKVFGKTVAIIPLWIDPEHVFPLKPSRPHILPVNALRHIRVLGTFDDRPTVSKQRDFVVFAVIFDIGAEHELVG